MSDKDRIVELEAAMKDVIIRLEELERGQKEAEKVTCDGCRKRIPEDEAISGFDGEKVFCDERCLGIYARRRGTGERVNR